MGRPRPPIIPRLAGAQHDGARGLGRGPHHAGGPPRARLPQQRGGARRGDRASVDRKGRRWTAAAAGRREFGCTRRRSAKAALDCCPSYSGGRLRRLPGACGCAEYCSRVYLTRRRNRPKNPFFQEDFEPRRAIELVLLHVSRLESLPWRHSCNPAAGVENQHACGCCRAKTK